MGHRGASGRPCACQRVRPLIVRCEAVMSIVTHSVDHRGMTSSTCPNCGTLFAYWEEEDLDEDGNLICSCDDELDEEEVSTYVEPDMFVCADCLVLIVNGNGLGDDDGGTARQARIDAYADNGTTYDYLTTANADDEGSFHRGGCDICADGLGALVYGIVAVKIGHTPMRGTEYTYRTVQS